MNWTKGKIEKAWRIFDKSMGVIADALEVDVLELKALLLDGTLPIYDRTPAEEIRNMEAAGVDIAAVMAERQVDQDLAPRPYKNPNDGLTTDEISEMNRAANSPVWLDETPPALTPEAFQQMPHPKRATLADLAAPAPEVVLEQAAPIIEKPLQFRPEPKRPAYVAPVSRPAPNAVPAVDQLIGEALEDRPLPRRRSNLASSAEDKRRASKPAEFYLMHECRYLHQSCEGLTDKREHAWRQPEGKIAAVRRKFPETVDYTEVPAS